MIAKGTFEVSLTPQTDEISGTSVGQMLSIRTAVQGSAGYVAMEEVTGTLNGQSGSFALQHNGIMSRGAPSLWVTVVPDSATGELEGLEGEMTIDINEGVHSYEFKYNL